MRSKSNAVSGAISAERLRGEGDARTIGTATAKTALGYYHNDYSPDIAMRLGVILLMWVGGARAYLQVN